MILLRGLMALIFGAGALVMVAGAVAGGLFVIAALSRQVHAIAGLVAFVAFLYAGHYHRSMIAAPWQIWMGLWGHVDDWLANLGRTKNETHRTCDPDAPRRLRFRR